LYYSILKDLKYNTTLARFVDLCYHISKIFSVHTASKQQKIKQNYKHYGGPGSVVGIVIGYMLDGPGIKSRWGARFSTPVQTTPGAHQASYTMGTESFPG
jgi:hypothetical protein